MGLGVRLGLRIRICGIQGCRPGVGFLLKGLGLGFRV